MAVYATINIGTVTGETDLDALREAISTGIAEGAERRYGPVE